MNYITFTIHLGSGDLGQQRREALQALAAEKGHYWGGEPSIGRWFVALADERIEMNQRTLYDIPNGIGAKSIQLETTGHKELINIPGSSCCIVGCTNKATRSVRVADGRGTKGSYICFEHREKDPNFGRTDWPHPLEGMVA